MRGKHIGRLTVAINFEPRDLWVGVFWKKAKFFNGVHVYVCLLPTLPIRLTWRCRGG